MIEDFPDFFEYCLKLLATDELGIISIVLGLHASVAALVTRPWSSFSILFPKLIILLLLPVSMLFLASYLQAPTGVFRSGFSLEPLIILGVFILNIIVVIWTVIATRGIRWFALSVSLFLLWFSLICFGWSEMAVMNMVFH